MNFSHYRAATLLLSAVITGCSAPSADSVRREVNREIKPGMTKAEVVNKLTHMGFNCHQEKTSPQYCDQSYSDNLIGTCVRNARLYFKDDGTLDKVVVSEGFCSSSWGK